MKLQSILIILLLFVSFNAFGQDLTFLKDGQKIERDYFNKSKMNIIDKDYKKVGTIERDFFNPNKLIIYDSSHKRIGKIEPDFFNKDKWRITV